MTTEEALNIHKYGALETWKELLFYQRHCNDPKQLQEIAAWAKRYNNEAGIKLPLRLNVIKQEDLSLEEAEKIFM